MKTPEERAEELVVVEQYHDTDSYYVVLETDPDSFWSRLDNLSKVEKDVADIRRAIAATIRQAVEEDRDARMLDWARSGLSEERLVEIQDKCKTTLYTGPYRELIVALHEILTHVRAQAAVIGDCANDGDAAIRDAGYVSGWQACREEAIRRADNCQAREAGAAARRIPQIQSELLSKRG